MVLELDRLLDVKLLRLLSVTVDRLLKLLAVD